MMKFGNTIINFHVIKNVDWMEKIIILLNKHFEFVSINDLEKFYYEDHNLKNACHITVDDGDVSVYSHLFPLVKKYRIPISIYVSPQVIKTGKNFWFQEIGGYDLKDLLDFYGKNTGQSIDYINKHQAYGILKSLTITELNSLIAAYKKANNIGDKERMGLTLEQLLEMKETGLVEIGAHTFNHPILKNENFEIAKFEIQRCIEELMEMINQKVICFAYPNGVPGLDYSEREIDLLKESGIKLAFSTENKRFSKLDNPLSIPRTGISKGSLGFILAKLALGREWDLIKNVFNKNQENEYRNNFLNTNKLV